MHFMWIHFLICVFSCSYMFSRCFNSCDTQRLAFCNWGEASARGSSVLRMLMLGGTHWQWAPVSRQDAVTSMGCGVEQTLRWHCLFVCVWEEGRGYCASQVIVCHWGSRSCTVEDCCLQFGPSVLFCYFPFGTQDLCPGVAGTSHCGLDPLISVSS